MAFFRVIQSTKDEPLDFFAFTISYTHQLQQVGFLN